MKLTLTILLFSTLSLGYAQEKKVLVNTLGVDSIVQVFHNNGELFFQVPFKNGKQNGWYEQYYDNSFVHTKDLRVDGKTVDCFFQEFHDDGSLYREGYMENGHQVGKWYAYTSDGAPFKIYIYNKKGDWVKLKVWNDEKIKWEKSGLY